MALYLKLMPCRLLKNIALDGEVRFNYSNNNGLFRIGKDELEFTSEWTRASNTSIHCYNNHLKGVAVAPIDSKLDSLSSVSSFNFTSRRRSPKTGQFVILQNENNFYAVIKILSIKDDARGDNVDELYFKYWINKSGSDDFSKLKDEL